MNLTRWEEVTLIASVVFIWHARYKQAKEHTGINIQQWREAAKSLLEKGLLAHTNGCKFTPTAAGMEWARGKRLEYPEEISACYREHSDGRVLADGNVNNVLKESSI